MPSRGAFGNTDAWPLWPTLTGRHRRQICCLSPRHPKNASSCIHRVAECATTGGKSQTIKHTQLSSESSDPIQRQTDRATILLWVKSYASRVVYLQQHQNGRAVIIHACQVWASIYQTWAQLLLKWLRIITQVEFLLSNGVPLFNALFLSNLWIYHHISHINVKKKHSVL